MEHIKETLNSDYKFRTLTADDGYIIAIVGAAMKIAVVEAG